MNEGLFFTNDTLKTLVDNIKNEIPAIPENATIKYLEDGETLQLYSADVGIYYATEKVDISLNPNMSTNYASCYIFINRGNFSNNIYQSGFILSNYFPSNPEYAKIIAFSGIYNQSVKTYTLQMGDIIKENGEYLTSNFAKLSDDPTQDNHVARKKYVDDLIGGLESKGIQELNSNINLSDLQTGIYINNSSTNIFIDSGNGRLTSFNKGGMIIYSKDSYHAIVLNGYGNSQIEFWEMYPNQNVKKIETQNSWGSNYTTLLTQDILSRYALTKNNTKAFTPTGAYNPATKQYVDESIQSAIGSALNGSY